MALRRTPTSNQSAVKEEEAPDLSRIHKGLQHLTGLIE